MDVPLVEIKMLPRISFRQIFIRYLGVIQLFSVNPCNIKNQSLSRFGKRDGSLSLESNYVLMPSKLY